MKLSEKGKGGGDNSVFLVTRSQKQKLDYRCVTVGGKVYFVDIFKNVYGYSACLRGRKLQLSVFYVGAGLPCPLDFVIVTGSLRKKTYLKKDRRYSCSFYQKEVVSFLSL